MSGLQSKELSEEIYHRIYRLIKRKLSAHTIAATLHLPVRTVIGVINRLERSEAAVDTASAKEAPTGAADNQVSDTDYLDIYFYPKTRYAILDLVGVLSEERSALLQSELQKIITSNWKAVALRMSHVTILSEAAVEIIRSGKDEFAGLGRFLGLLDPAPEIEATLEATRLEDSIPVFGTERAFEEAAFAKKGKLYSRRGNNSSV